jgi:hypothetical protein
MPVWEYYAANPDEGARFDAAMASITGRLAEAVVSSYDFSGFGRVVDVGGGDGTLLAAILRSAPSARGVLFDVPAVVDRAKPTLESAGVLDRTELVGGDFRAALPPGADCCVLKWILHDWEDEVCTTILRRCREEAVTSTGGAKLVVIERVLPKRVGPEHLDLVVPGMIVDNCIARRRGGPAPRQRPVPDLRGRSRFDDGVGGSEVRCRPLGERIRPD